MTSSVVSGGPFKSRRLNAWLNRRMPPANSVELNQGNIFILPTREGFYFLALVALMVLAGINFQNSLVFLISFLLFSIFMVSILHTFRNLSGLNLQAGSTRPAFAGEDAEFTVIVHRRGERIYEGIRLGWSESLMQGVDLVDDEEQRVSVYVPTSRRGRFNPGRMLIQTSYPVGLFRAWSWVDLDMSVVVFPRPIYAGDIPDAISQNNDGDMLHREGVDDFYGLRDYRDGDPVRHIAWKSYARTEQLQTKEFVAFVDRRIWLEWDMLAGLDRESRLSRLCYWILKVSESNDEFGLRLPGIEIEPDRGMEHRERLLTELALFEVDQRPGVVG